ncbi:S-type pyocin domain-containing protein, partial [Pseudomonas sp.]|uniref:S-type pyocin domain-containing protein n=1 Tax=Pseudomonas sp. TaxID=306 RepID=UPI0028AB0D91
RIAAEAAQAEAARIAAEAAQAEAARIAAEAAQAEAARIAAEAAQAEAARIAAEAAQAEAARIAAEAAQAEAARIAAEAAQAEAARIAAEAMSVRIANTYAAPAAPVKAGVAVVTPSGLVVSTLTSAAMRAAVTAAIGVVAANPVVAAGAVLGVAALVYTSRLGDGKAPERYTLQLPAGDLLAQAVGEGLQPKAGTTVDLPYRIGSRSNATGDSEIFVAKTDNVNAPAAVRVIGASYDQASGLYIATTADTPPRTLTWTPAVAPGDSSTTSPEVNPEPPIYSGATITPIDLRIDSFPELEDASFDDYIIVFPADSGLDPIYTMFKSRRDEPGVATGGSVPSTENWVDAAASMTGASIPISIAEKLRGREFRSFGAFRRALWKAMYKEAKNSSGVEQYIYGAKPGSAPYTKESERVGGRSRYEIHHVIPIHAGGAVYDMDNLRILTPKQHINIHKK